MNLKKKMEHGMFRSVVMGILVLIVGGGLVQAKRNGSLFVAYNDNANEKVSPKQTVAIVNNEVKVEDRSLSPSKVEVQDVKNEITLRASVRNGGVDLNWDVDGEISGFKVVGSLNENPSYPDDKYYYVDGSKRSFFWGVHDGREWHFRVCEYEGGKCLKYSNEVVVRVLKPAVSSTDVQNENKDSAVKSISVRLEKVSSEKVKVSWSVNGKAERGFKVIWSKNPNPEYPTRSGDYFHYVKGGDVREEVIKTGSGHVYHVRVCNYLGNGKCGTYSPDVEISM